MFFWRLLLVCLPRYVFFHNRSLHHMLLSLNVMTKAHGGGKMIFSLNAQAEFQFSRSFSIRNFLRCHHSGDVNLRPLIKRRVNNQVQIIARPDACPFEQRRHNMSGTIIVATIAPNFSDRAGTKRKRIFSFQNWILSERKTQWIQINNKTVPLKLKLNLWLNSVCSRGRWPYKQIRK